MASTIYPVTELDSNLVIRHAYDETTQSLRVHTGDIVVSGEVEVAINQNNDSILVYGNDGSTNQILKTDSSGRLQIDILTSTLPIGASTSVLQNACNISLDSIDTKLDSPLGVLQSGSWDINNISGMISLPIGAATENSLSGLNNKIPLNLSTVSSRLLVDGSGVIQPISAASLPLPNGAATSANQEAQINSLSSIDSKLSISNSSLSNIDAGIPAGLGQTVMASAMPVVIASNQPQELMDFTLSGKLYSIGLDVNMASAGTNNPLVLFRNPSGSGKVLYIKNIDIGTTVTNVAGEYKIFSTPTVTVIGTLQTAVSRYVGGVFSAVALISTLPAVSSAGSQLFSIAQGQNTNTLNLSNSISLAIATNNSILITGNPSSNGRNASIGIEWLEI